LKGLAVIPAFNAAATIGDVVTRCAVIGVLDQVLVIDDGSGDETADNAAGAGAVLIKHEVNRGKGAALRTGFAYAVEQDYDAVITLDADGQHEPESIPDFLDQFEAEGYPVILGNRMLDPAGMPWLRRATNRTTSWIVSRIAGQEINDSQCGYRFYTTSVLTRVHLEMDRYDAESEILVKAAATGFKVGAVPIRTIYADESSFISPWRDTLRFIRMVIRARGWKSG